MGLKFDGAEGQEQGRTLYECGESGCVSLSQENVKLQRLVRLQARLQPSKFGLSLSTSSGK